MKILIAEDTEDSRVLLEMILLAQGYDVLSGINGVEALQLARATPPDLIISDILMPEMDGFELCRQLKADPELKHIPFIFYTATYTEQQDQELAMALGAARFIIKPVEPLKLMEIIHQVLEQSNTEVVSVLEQEQTEDAEVEKMYTRSLVRKLDKKIREIEKERDRLRESEEKYRALIETTSDWIWEADENAIYTYSSPKIRDLLGYEPDEVIGKTPFDLMSSEEAGRVADIFSLVVSAQKPFSAIENTNVHKDGHLVILETSAVPVFDKEGCFRGY